MKPSVVASATVPLASPSASAGWKFRNGKAGTFRAGACAASELGVTPIRLAVIFLSEPVPDTITCIPSRTSASVPLTSRVTVVEAVVLTRTAGPMTGLITRVLPETEASVPMASFMLGQLVAVSAAVITSSPAHTRGERGRYPQPAAAQDRHGYRGGRGRVPCRQAPARPVGRWRPRSQQQQAGGSALAANRGQHAVQCRGRGRGFGYDRAHARGDHTPAARLGLAIGAAVH